MQYFTTKLSPLTKFILIAFTIWRLGLELVRIIGNVLFPMRVGYIGPTPWANFDGVHYISIAQNGYYQYEQAFFPLYPLLMRLLGAVLGNNYALAGLIISHTSLLGSLWFLSKILENTDAIPQVKRPMIIRWTIAFLLVFPTSFYFASVYSESLFLFLILGSFYALSQKRYVLYGVLASLASAARVIGAFLLVPFGLFGYMFYLWKMYGDGLLFIHAQPAFGANRGGGDIILLPQVLWRYTKILTTVPVSSYDYWIAVLELLTLFGVLYLIYRGLRHRLPRSWIAFSVASILGPPLTGSLSSVPRYVLSAFPIYLVLAHLPQTIRTIIFGILCILLIVLTILFTSGYWVS